MEEEQLIHLPSDEELPPAEPLIELPTDPAYKPVDKNVAAVRAFKAQYGLGFLNHPFQYYYDAMVAGRETETREEVSSELDSIKSQKRMEVIQSVGERITPELMDFVDNSLGTKIKTDPTTVFERQYGTEYLNYLDGTNVGWRPQTFFTSNNALTKLKEYSPETAKVILETGSHAVAKQQIALRGLHMAEAAAEGQSWMGWIGDTAKPIFWPPYESQKLADVVPKDTPTALLLSEDLLSTQYALFDLPTDMMEKIYIGTLERLIEDNPGLAVKFARSMVSLGRTERRMIDIGQTIDFVSKPILIDITKGIYKGASNRLIGTEIYKRRMGEYLDARNAALDMIKRDAVTPNPTRATIAEAAGDVGEAAVQKSTDNIIAAVEGRAIPEVQAIEPMHAAIRVDIPAVVRVTDPALGGAAEAAPRAVIGDVALAAPPPSTIPPAGAVSPRTEIPLRIVENKAKDGTVTYSAYGGNRNLSRGFNTEEEARTAAEIWIGNHGRPRVGTAGKAYTPDTVPTKTITPPEPLPATGTPPPAGAVSTAPPSGGGGAVPPGGGGGGVPPAPPTPPVPPAGGLPPSGSLHVNASPALVAKVDEVINSMGPRFLKLISNIARVDRVPFEVATQKAAREIVEYTKKSFGGLENTVVNTDIRYNPITNTWFTENYLGKEGGEYFASRSAALNWAHYHGFKDATAVEQVGAGWRFMVRKNIDESAPYIQSRINETAFQKPPSPFLAFIAQLRTPEDILSLEHRAQRKIAVYGQNNLLQFIRDNTKYTKELINGVIKTDPVTGERVGWLGSRLKAIKDKNFGGSAQRYHDLEIAIKDTPNLINPMTGERGYMFQHVHEVQDYYRRSFRRDPEAIEVLAYLEQSRLAGIMHQLENLAVYRNLASAGNETHQIIAEVGRTPGPRKGAVNIQKDRSDFFEAKIVQELPTSKEGTLLIANNNLNEWEVLSLANIPPSRQTIINKSIANGEIKLLQMADSDKNPFLAIGGTRYNLKRQLWAEKRPQYVLAKNVETSELRHNLVPQSYKHFEHDVSHTIAQPIITKEKFTDKVVYDWYMGDRHVAGAVNSVIGKQYAERLDNVRKMIKARNELPRPKPSDDEYVRSNLEAAIRQGDEAIRDYIERNLPWDHDTVTGWFKPTPKRYGTAQAMLNLDHRIQVLPRNTRSVDMHKEVQDFYNKVTIEPETGRKIEKNTYRDGQKQGNPAKEYQVKFTNESIHDMTEIGTDGSWFRPLVSVKPAPYVSPITSLNRSLAKMVDHIYLDDYKIYAMNSWLQRAQPYLAATPEQIRTSPLYHFFQANTDWQEAYKAGKVPEAVAPIQLLEAEKYHIRNLLGVPSKTDNWFHSKADLFADAIFNKSPGVYNFLRSSKVLDPQWLLPAIPDGARAARAFVFHTTMGLFNHAQLLAQNMSWVNIYSIGGYKAASKAGVANILHTWRPHAHPGVIDAWDKYAVKMGFGRPGEFTEASDALNKYGFEKVGIEHVMRDASPTVMTTRFGNFLDFGAIFFRSAERNVRRGAWFAAYSERRAAVGAGPFTKTDWKWVLDRADLMAGNMSEASRSMLQRGVMSFSTQFLGYTMRMTEMFLGRRLGEGLQGALNKGRLFFGNALAFGIPSAVGLTGLPLGDYFRTKAKEYGWDVSDNFITNVLYGGLPAATTQLVTGWSPDVGRRYGPQSPVQSVVDALYGDKYWLEVILGAGTTKFKDAYQSADGAMYAIANWDRANPLRPEDAIDIAKNISSANNAWKYWMALNTGRIWSKNESFQDDKISTAEASALWLTGLSTQQAGDVFMMQQAQKTRQQMWEKAEKEAAQEYRRGIRMLGETGVNEADAADYISRANHILEMVDYPVELRSHFLSKVFSEGNESLAYKMDKAFSIKNLPRAEQRKYLDNYVNRQQILNERIKY